MQRILELQYIAAILCTSNDMFGATEGSSGTENLRDRPLENFETQWIFSLSGCAFSVAYQSLQFSSHHHSICEGGVIAIQWFTNSEESKHERRMTMSQ
jgi:hypothetical protein